MAKLKGGDLRSIGKANEVAESIIKNPKLFQDVFEGVFNDEPLIRMRAADALEKVSSKHPEYLQPFKARLIKEVSKIAQQEVQWHAAQMFGYIELTQNERDEIIEILFAWLDDSKSNIVKVCSMQTLAEFAEKDEKNRSKIINKITNVIRKGRPSVVSRGKKLLAKLERH